MVYIPFAMHIKFPRIHVLARPLFSPLASENQPHPSPPPAQQFTAGAAARTRRRTARAASALAAAVHAVAVKVDAAGARRGRQSDGGMEAARRLADSGIGRIAFIAGHYF